MKGYQLGAVYAAETGFILGRNPDTVRAPDVAFVQQERLNQAGKVKGYFVGPPDLAIEVIISPGNTVREVEEKVAEWIGAGARMVWILSPKQHTVTIYRSLTDRRVLTEEDTLNGDDLLPGFRIAVAEIFEGA